MATQSTIPFASLQQFVMFGIDAGNLVGQVAGSGGFNFGEVSTLFSLYSEGKDALSHFADLKVAVAQLTGDQEAALLSAIAAKLSIPQTSAQAVINKALLSVNKLYELYLIWK